MDELMKMVYTALGYSPAQFEAVAEKQRATRLELMARANCGAGKHSWCVVRDGTKVCVYCSTVGDVA